MANRTAQTNNAQPNAPIIIKCAVKSIQVYGNGDNGVRYRATIDQEIDAIQRNEDGDYVTAKVDYIDFFPSVLIAQCINHIEGLDLLYTKKKEVALRNANGNTFGAAELQVVLSKAKLTIERKRFEAGDEYTDSNGETATHENAGYNTDITDIQVSDKVQTKLDSVMDSVFDI